MADREEFNKQYSYAAMSSKVEQAVRTRNRNSSEPTGEVETLRGRQDIGRMGDRVVPVEPARKQEAASQPPRKKAKRSSDNNDAAAKRKTSSKKELAVSGDTILDLGHNLGSSYQPSTEQARLAYERLLTLLSGRNFALATQGPTVLKDAAEEVIVILKDEDRRDPEKHDDLSKLLTGKSVKQTTKGGGGGGSLSTEHFTAMVQIGKQLDDYYHRDEAGENTNAAAAAEMDDEMGVAVVFDDEEASAATGGDDSDAAEQNVVMDTSSSSSSDDEESEAENLVADGGGGGNIDNDDEDNEKQVLVPDKKSKSSKEDRVLSVHEIDAHFLQRQLSRHLTDADESARKADEVLQIIDIRGGNQAADLRECENKLLVLLGFDLFPVIQLILRNRVKVWACVSMKRAQTDTERTAIDESLENEPTGVGKRVLEEMHSGTTVPDWTASRGFGDAAANKEGDAAADVSKAIDAIGGMKKDEVSKGNSGAMDVEKKPIRKQEAPTDLDFETLALRDGAHTMSNKTCVLPDTSWRAMKKGYEEVHVPSVRTVPSKDEKLVAIKDLPAWTQVAFQDKAKPKQQQMTHLNRIQSPMYDIALKTSENILLCAPTGAGKTNVALLTMLNVLGQYRRERKSEEDKSVVDEEPSSKDDFDLQSFKIVYISPMKALVQEQVKNFQGRLKDYGISVRELSGDSSLTRQQIADTQLLVTTPEKWDIVTRQGEGRAYTQLVKLVIIDEIHLLHDERGPVLESIVARIIRQVESTAEPIRLVGLSATLPNYADVATFLRVKPDKGLFFFDHTYRPVPLQMQYLGITERNAFKRFQLQNEICYEKAIDQRREKYQMLIFVHSRAECGKTARALRDLAMERDTLSQFVRDGSASQEILREEALSAKNADLKEVLPYGFAIHHAGMARDDRALVEDLFDDKHIAVLCCTATLAWGINLPAHAVIIRGTQIYDPSKGRWAELSPLDVLQMLGRAGRPQHDSFGEGILLTQHSQLQYYLSLTNLQLPVESQLIKTLPDHLNAEVVLGAVQSIDEAMDWLSYTFLYVRMLQNPKLYGISEDLLKDDHTLKARRRDLAHTAAVMLEKSHLVRYDRKSGALQATPLGRVASQFYITHSSMRLYTLNMRPNMSEIELLRLFALSGEFAHITVREEEKLELTKLSGRVPIPVKESPSEPSAKVNMLLQAYISRLKLDGFALVADMAFVQQSAARIMRALFEIALRRHWSSLAKLCLDMANMVSYRVWRSQSPLRQFKNVPEIVCRKLERKSDIDWGRYADLTPSDLGELVGVAKMGRVLHKLVHQFPRLELSAQVQPITRSMLRVELTLVPAFQYDIDFHGYSQLFHVIVEDVNGETILHHETFTLKSRDSKEEHMIVFTVPILEPLPPAYFIRVLSDRWLHSSSVLPISFATMILPSKFPPPTELLDLQPLLPSALGEPSLTKIFPFEAFNPVQTQTFHELFKTKRNCLICAPSNSGKTVCAAFAILHMLTTNPDGKCVIVSPSDEIADPAFAQIAALFGKLLRGSLMVRLTGETAPDLKLLASGKIIVASVRQWDILSRRWSQRKAVQAVTLMIFDDLHFLGGELGPTMEVVISRARYMSSQLHQSESSEGGIRIVGLSASLANARDIGEWMGVPSKSLFNFSPKARALPLEIYFQSFEQSNYSSRLMAMGKPVYSALMRHCDGKSALIYVPSKRQAQLTAIDIMTYGESQELSFVAQSGSETVAEAAKKLREPALHQVISAGIAFVHNGMLEGDWKLVVDLFRKGIIRVLVCPADLCWRVRCVAHLVVIMGTESFDGREGRHVDYPIVDLLHMMGRHDPNSSSKCVVLCHAPKKEYLKKLLYEPLPIESHLDSYLHDPLNSEVVTKTVSSMQDAIDYLTWTFLYRRLSKNPTYYGLRGTSNEVLSEHLSEMVETVLGDLEESKCCRISEEGDVSALNLGMIAAYYYVQYRTIELVASSVTEKTKIRGVLEILSAAWEFSTLPIRYGEDKSLKILARNLVHKIPNNAVYDSNTKALVLLQCHFSRKPVPEDMRADQKVVLKEAVNLIQAIVDVISSNSWLKPALAAMELSQMVVQGLWNKDHPLRQIPHFSDGIVKRCLAHKGDEPIESVFDILTLDDDVRNELLQLPDEKMADVAVFCNNYPNVEVSFKVQDSDDVTEGDPVQIVVELEREVDEDEITEEELADLGRVSAPLFPSEKKESWWIVVGDTTRNTLLSLKRTNLRHKQKIVLEFLAPEEAGDYDLTLFCMSDSYLGCDQEYSIPLSVAAAGSDDDSSEENE